MKIGVCIGTNFENAKLAKEIGYDYVESNCGGIVNFSDEELENFKNLGIPVLAANCFIGLRVVGPEKNPEAINEYLDKLFERASYLGLKYLVFGSSGARKMKDGEGMTPDSTRAEIADFLKTFVAPRAEKYKITIAIEPLRFEECNVLNTVPQGIEIARKVNSPYVKVLADVKHMLSSDDPLEKLADYSEWLVHAHTSNPFPEDGEHKRIYPAPDDKFNQDDFMNPLVAAGVTQCSIEADCIDFKVDAVNGFEALKKYR